MPKVPGLSDAQRKALVADQLADEGSEPIDLPASPQVAADWPKPPGASVAPTAPALDTAALIQMLVAALQQSGADTAQAIRDGLSNATSMARTPIPENQIAPGYSVYAHPEGDQKHPRTKLRCPMYLGVYDERGKATPAFEIFGDVCTEHERELLNHVRNGEYRVSRNDGREAIWKVVEEKDALGAITRLVIAVPAMWLSKEEQNQMPGQPQFLQALVAAHAA